MTDNEKIMRKAIEKFGVKAQIDVCIEEMSELIKALLKHRRYNAPGTLNSIAEELADAEICCDYIHMIYGIDDKSVDYIKSYKLDRLLKRMEESEVEAEK